MDARTLSRLVGTPAGTLNAWVQRYYVPGMGVNPRGRRRDFDLETAMHVAVMAELMPYGLGPEWAAEAAKSAVAAHRDRSPDGVVVYSKTEKKWALYVNGNDPSQSILQLNPEERPDVYTFLNIARIAEKIRQAEEEYQATRKARDTKADD